MPNGSHSRKVLVSLFNVLASLFSATWASTSFVYLVVLFIVLISFAFHFQ